MCPVTTCTGEYILLWPNYIEDILIDPPFTLRNVYVQKRAPVLYQLLRRHKTSYIGNCKLDIENTHIGNEEDLESPTDCWMCDSIPGETNLGTFLNWY